MLRITMSKSADGAKKYYSEPYYKEGLSAQRDYYAENNEMIGRWGGKAADALGLSGDIARNDFAMLCDNISPLTRKTLTGRQEKDRTVGYDFTFNASKSVSLAYAFGSTEQKNIILNAFHQSVHDTMQEVETGMQARVRASGKNENRLTENIAYGEFTHFTTRPIDGIPDPHLHSHCFVFNATYDDQDKKWKAGQFRQINQDAPYYEAIFHSKLAHHLQTAGYRIERTKNGFELTGISKETIEKYSRRTQEIEDYSREHQITDDKQKSKVGAKTREAKRILSSSEAQETEWFSRLTTEELTAILSLKQDKGIVHDSHVAIDAVDFSLKHHLERKSVASDKEILATAIKSSIGDATPDEIKRVFENDSNILSATEKLRTFITTKEALQEERELIQRCTASRNKFRPINENYVPQNPQLNDQQQAAVMHALSSTDGIILITGKAGTGKTTLMKEVQQGILANGKRIFSFAPSSEASRGVQRSEGFTDANTVAALLTDTRLHPQLKHQVIWVDEAGMLSNRDMNAVLSIAEAQGSRVILSGDSKQHNSVDRGDALRIIQQETAIKPVTVDKIQRQQHAVYKEAVHLLSHGKVEQGFTKLDQIGAIHEMPDSKERIEAIADEYYRTEYDSYNKPAKEVLVIAPTHAEGDVVTEKIRERLREHQIIGQEERSYVVLKNRNLTEAEKLHPESYLAGDVVAFHQHSKGVKAGKRLEVLKADSDNLFAKDTSGTDYAIALSEAKKFTVYEPRQLHVAEGDKIRITGNGKCLDGKSLFNGSTYHIEGFDTQGNIELSNGSSIAPEFGHFTMGYVGTSHASQGKTADKVIISQSSATFRASSMEQFYVSVSRGRQAVSIYTDDKEHLLDAVSHSSERTSASELMEKRNAQAQEINRLAQFRQWQDSHTSHTLTNQISNDGLQATARTEQNQACR